jgi:hypothetical protein
MEQLPFTTLLHKFFGGTALAVLHALHIPPGNARAPIPNYFAMQILVAVILISLFVIVPSRLSVENPDRLAARCGRPPGICERAKPGSHRRA